ncbi:FtsX-like permease family protein [bacterium]|nr:FtsX-like permease family protein [bacterium]
MKKQHPPKLAQLILARMIEPGVRDAAMGDFEEQYIKQSERCGRFTADCYYLKEIAGGIWSRSWSFYQGRSNMLRNYAITSLRNLKRSHIYTSINLCSLAIAITWAILVFCYVRTEINFDQFHEKGERLALVTALYQHDGYSAYFQSQAPLGPAIVNESLDFDGYARLINEEKTLKYDKNLFNISILGTDPDFFEMFTFPLKWGSSENFEKHLYVMYLSHSMSGKIYGDENPIGRQLSLKIGAEFVVFNVAGVFEPLPGGSSIQFDCVVAANHFIGDNENNWSHVRVPLCLHIADDQPVESVYKHFEETAAPYLKSLNIGKYTQYKSQSLQSYHLNNQYHFSSLEAPSSKTPSLVLALIAVLVLIIAAINYINLSMGCTFYRFKEVGVRKVMGAERQQIIRQFLVETFLLVVGAIGMGLLLAQLALPIFNQLTQRDIISLPLSEPLLWILFTILILFLVGLSGGYPAWRLSKVEPVQLFNRQASFTGKQNFSRSLMVFQFAISIFLICSTLVILRQHQYMLKDHFGANLNQVIEIDISKGGNTGKTGGGRSLAFKGKLNQIKGIEALAYTKYKIAYTMANIIKDVRGQNSMICSNQVESSFFKTMDIQFIKGGLSELGVNERAVFITERLKKDFVEGDALYRPLQEVLKDTNFCALPIYGIIPAMNLQYMRYGQVAQYLEVTPHSDFSTLYVRINANQIGPVLSQIREVFQSIYPDIQFDYQFLDDIAASSYEEEVRWSRIVKISAIVALFIACSGLFGLTLLTLIRRRKELSVRRVLGAGFIEIQHVISRDFLIILLISNALAWPTAYLVMKRWLEDYSHRISLSWWLFPAASAIAIAIALITILLQTLRAIQINPIENLRDE